MIGLLTPVRTHKGTTLFNHSVKPIRPGERLRKTGGKTRSALLLALSLACLPGMFRAGAQTAPDAPESAASLPEALIEKLSLGEEVKASILKAVRAKDYQRAESILLDSLAHAAHSERAGEVLVLLGDVYFCASDYPQAVIAWIKSDAISPLDDRTRFQLATTEVYVGRSDLARKQFVLLANKNKDTALYQYWLARLDYDAQQYKAAILRLEQVVKLEPGMARGYDLLGLCHDFEGDSQAAIQAYAIAVRLNRRSPHPSSWPPLDYAITLINVNRLDEASGLLHEAISYDSSNFKAVYEAGCVRESKGDFNGAVDSFTEAARLNAKYPEPHYALARLYRRLGKPDLADHEVDLYKTLHQQAAAHP